MKRHGNLIFRDRMDAGRQLGEHLQGRALRSPLVLGIPRGGVVVAHALARAHPCRTGCRAARKLRDPWQPEYAVGAISERGDVILNPQVEAHFKRSDYLEEEKRFQLAEILRRKELFRSVRPAAAIAGRSVLVTDDGIATGSTMIAALQGVRVQEPHELMVAVPVAAPGRLEPLREYCDDVVCLTAPNNFYAVGQFYDEFEQVEDEVVVRLLREAASGEPKQFGLNSD